jgi:hypothetical protein
MPPPKKNIIFQNHLKILVFRERLLVDDSDAVADFLLSDNSDVRIVDLVMDNAGFELFADLCLAGPRKSLIKIFLLRTMKTLFRDTKRHRLEPILLMSRDRFSNVHVNTPVPPFGMFICQSRKSRDGSRERSQWNWFTSKF